MKHVTVLLVAGILASAATEKIRNEKVTVTEDRLAPGESRTITADRPTLLVYLDGPRQGQVEFLQGGDSGVRIKSSTELRFARIEFLGKGRDETWGKSGISPNYKLLLENLYARAYYIHIAAGTKEPQHTHHDRIVICFSGANMIHILPDGRTETSTLKTGEIAWRRGATHVGQNLDKVDFRAVAIEPK